jgi:hypothetical protein
VSALELRAEGLRLGLRVLGFVLLSLAPVPSPNTHTDTRDRFQGSIFGVESWGLSSGFVVCGLRVESPGFGGEGCEFFFFGFRIWF